MKILFNGCSMVEKTSTNFWTDLCAAQLNSEYINLGTTMASNDHILRTTIDWLCTHTADIVCVGWTSMDRAELPLKNGDYIRMTPYASNSVQTGPAEDYHKNYYTDHYNQWVHFQKTLRSIYIVNTICNQKNVLCLNLNSVYHNNLHNSNTLKQHSLWNIRKNRPDNPLALEEYCLTESLAQHARTIKWILPSKLSLVDWCKQNNLPQDQWGHPIDNANQSIATYMSKKINDFICEWR
jgi:hypothetical protein